MIEASFKAGPHTGVVRHRGTATFVRETPDAVVTVCWSIYVVSTCSTAEYLDSLPWIN